jgi:hypothetical protein
MAAEVGHLRLAYDYPGEAALMDFPGLENNTRRRSRRTIMRVPSGYRPAAVPFRLRVRSLRAARGLLRRRKNAVTFAFGY